MPSIQLRNVPDDVYCFIQKSQLEFKLKRGTGVYSLESTVIKLLKEQVDRSKFKTDITNKRCSCGNAVTDKEIFYETCLKCGNTLI